MDDDNECENESNNFTEPPSTFRSWEDGDKGGCFKYVDNPTYGYWKDYYDDQELAVGSIFNIPQYVYDHDDGSNTSKYFTALNDGYWSVIEDPPDNTIASNIGLKKYDKIRSIIEHDLSVILLVKRGGEQLHFIIEKKRIVSSYRGWGSLFEEPKGDELSEGPDFETKSLENTDPPSLPIQKIDIFYPDPQVIQNLKTSLTSRYGARSLEDIFSGKHLENEHGGFFIVRDQYPQNEYSVADIEQACDMVKQHLCVIPGIGETLEKELRGRGYNSINDLLRHQTFSSNANDFLQILGNKDFNALHDWLSSRPLPKSHPVRLLSSCFQDMSKLLFIDIETLSLYPTSPLILIGVAFFKPDGFLAVEQYLARDIADEKAILSHIVNSGKFKTILTFNGSTFDLPYMRSRCNYYGIEGPFDHPHFDLLYFGRRIWKGQFSSYSLKTLEREILKIDRGDDVHPVYLIELYQEYLQTQKAGLLMPLIDHNRWDILSTVKLFTAMINKVVKDA
ncbi:MAG: ribonuclease H-like domain-containing protein [Deltaproteobacteria bacterium]|nr:ribonuclease H-like domain-containing protein [Deltaproteobacteria bacterium]